MSEQFDADGNCTRCGHPKFVHGSGTGCTHVSLPSLTFCSCIVTVEYERTPA